MIKRRYVVSILLIIISVFFSMRLSAEGNTTNESFAAAKKRLEQDVYFDHRITVYCEAEFNEQKHVKLPVGFETEKYRSRAERIEWEHIVPAENFGRTFAEWREGAPTCQEPNGHRFKGRKCAEIANREYRLMQADMYNLYPAIGAVNALRSNYNFTQFQSDAPSSFGTCQVKIWDRKVEPPAPVRGVIGRTYLYFEAAYPRYKMSDSNRKLMQAWDKEYPVSAWECRRACRIEKIQKNKNKILRPQCQDKNLWPKENEC